MRTKKGQRVNSIPTVVLSDKNTINWEVKTAGVPWWPSMKQYLAAFKTHNIRLQNIRGVYLTVSGAEGAGRQRDWTVVAHQSEVPWKAILVHDHLDLLIFLPTYVHQNFIFIVNHTEWHSNTFLVNNRLQIGHTAYWEQLSPALWHWPDPVVYQGGDSIHWLWRALAT